MNIETVEEPYLNISSKKKTKFIDDVFKLAFGTAFAQVITVLSAPFLTRLYAPAAFGALALFSSITSIIVLVSCMRYELSIMLPKSDKEAANLLGLSLMFVTLISLLTVPVVWCMGSMFLCWLKAPDLGPYLWLVTPAVFIGGVFLALDSWNSRTKHFARLSVARATSSVATTLAQLSAGYAGYATGGSLVSASVAGQVVSTVVLGGQIWRDEQKLFLGVIRWRDMIAGFKRHRKFMLYGSWTALLNGASWQLPAIILTAFFSPTIVGYYALGFSILAIPMNLLGYTIGQVFFQRATEFKSNGELPFFVDKVFRKLVTLALLPMLMLTIIGRDLYVMLFGANWAEAGVYTQILSIWVFFWFISSPISFLYNILEKQEFGLKINIAIFVTRLLSLGIGGFVGNARLAMVLFSTTGILVYGYLNLSLLKFSGLSRIKSIGIVLKEVVTLLPFVLIQIIVTTVTSHLWVRVSVAFISVVLYMIMTNINNLQCIKLKRWTC